MEQNRKRQIFELFCEQEGFDTFSHTGTGYNSKRTQVAWKGFKAAWNYLRPKTTKKENKNGR